MHRRWLRRERVGGEGWGKVPPEPMACGTSVVATNIRGNLAMVRQSWDEATAGRWRCSGD